LVQAGTEADNLSGSTSYSAWTEIIPAPSVPLSLTVNPGDHITVVVEETATNKWSMQVTDNTTGMSGGRTVTYHALGKTAEVVHERPCIGTGSGCSFATLATTSDATFDHVELSTSRPGTSPVFNPLFNAVPRARLYRIFMATSSTNIVASPSLADSDRDGMAVADGSVAPPAPSS
jgi:hypothetical protein